MDKDTRRSHDYRLFTEVSTLVLMDSWIKTGSRRIDQASHIKVSTLVLMDSWIKTVTKRRMEERGYDRFNPCFNGFMDKDSWAAFALEYAAIRFQPLF